MNRPTSRNQAAALDRRDPIAGFRDEFELPEGAIYLDGNSLGPPPKRVFSRIEEVLRREWAGDLIRSWTSHDWIDLAARVAAKISGLIGAGAHEVAVADSTSINLFKLLGAALRLRPGRRVILTEIGNFGTDLYVAQGLSDLVGEAAEVRMVDRSELANALDDSVAVLMLTQVDFRTGERHDLQRWTRKAHEAGAVVLWDLAHSVGAFDIDLAGCGADLAVGCGYKYLNGGPGAPAFAFVSECHHPVLETPLWGWMGHAAPFDFEPRYRPGPGVSRIGVGTPPILSLAALECGVDVVAEIGVDRLHKKSAALSELFIERVELGCSEFGVTLVSPRRTEDRGSQVSFRHPEGYAIIQALIAAGVIGDFRAPDVLRFGVAPAYLRFVDVWDAADAFREVLHTGSWDHPDFRIRAKVT